MIALLATIALIIYGSLYPFAFSVPDDGDGALRMLLESWDKRPGRGDFVANILLYMPLGFFGGVTIRSRNAAAHLWRVILLGAALSFAIELIQYYDTGRDTEASDLYANTFGTVLGALAGYKFGRGVKWSFLAGLPANPAPALLLTAWVGYRLYPYVPTIDLHKYWDALKPVFLHPATSPYAIFRHTAIWMGICLLVGKIAQPGQATRVFAAFAGLIVVGSILSISGQLTVPQLAGMALAFGIWRLTDERRHLPIAIALLGVYVVALRLEPFQFSAAARPFTWIPFQGFMGGSINQNVLSFCEKFFLYGTLIWLLVRSGVKLGLASLLVATLLFATSFIEIFIPGRSAEITDALMALGIGGLMSLIDVSPLAEEATDTLTARITAAGS